MDKGVRLGHYEILSLLGKGGMGEVYLARDTRLERRVALKILPADLATDSDRLARFIREAKSASALNHPNIITLHDVGETDGTHFIAYEFIDGTTLRQFARGPGFDLGSALEIAIQVASALEEAHRAGIVHRDLKPDNVMIRPNGLVKLLDFGIARLSQPTDQGDNAATALQTESGLLIGTPQFMSPEQARGLDVDHQTDIFSFGVVLHEMISGVSPFAADTVTDVVVAVLTRDPPRLTGVPPKLADIVTKALQKDRARRYPAVTELLRDLREVQSHLDGHHDPRAASAHLEVKSVAVLPFVNMSAEEDDEYFCDGLAEELLIALSKIDALKVAARTSAFSFKGKSADVGTIARALGVSNIVEGSVRRSGHRLRISVQLISAADGCQMWSERYDREMRDIFALQDEITLAIVEALKVRLLGEAKAAVLKRYTESAEAYELFLKGRFHSYKYTAHGWQRGIEFFEKAIDIQPDYAPAYAGIAMARGCQWFFGILPAERTISPCRTASARALAIDPNLAEAHLPRAIITFFHDWDWQKAAQEFQRTITLNPNNAEALSYYALFLTFRGSGDEAMRTNQMALTLDPLAPLINMNGGWTYFAAGMSAEASQQAA
ncbi:MAG TPA: protein kinase, partial [Vicinamibacterales bacterium]|nr:protein kinase [Vicinamibacterales bacterium]